MSGSPVARWLPDRPVVLRLGSDAHVAPLVAGVACIAIAAGSTVAAWNAADLPRWLWLLLICGGLSFGITGAVLWTRQPGNRTGPTMCAVGLTWYIGALQLSENPVVFGVGYSLCYITAAALSHLVLLQPSGRLETRFERVLVVTQYLAVPATDLPRFIGEYPPAPQFWATVPALPTSAWSIVSNATLAVFGALNIALLVRRWSGVGGPTRRKYAPVAALMATLGLLGLVDTAAALAGNQPGLRRVILAGMAGCAIVVPLAIAAGLLRFRMIELRVGELVLRLDRSAEPAQVRAAVAHALGDPALDICYPLPDGTGYTHLDGKPLTVADHHGRAATVVEMRGKPLAMLLHDRAVTEHRHLLDVVAATARMALDNARLVAVERARLDDVRESRARIVRAADRERERIQRDLHDGVQHGLLAVAMRLDRARSGPAAGGPDQLDAASRELRDLIRELRVLVEGIHPPALSEQGLAAAVEILAERAPLPVRAEIVEQRWPEPTERAAWFVITESLANAYKYSGASRVVVRVSGTPDRLIVRVDDDGLGGADARRGTGLKGLEDRVGAVGGTFHICSDHRRGTRITAEIPCEP